MANSVDSIQQKLKDEIGQNWRDTDNHRTYRDQFGNEIHKTQNGYMLYRMNEKVIEVNRLATAKLISNIILNDIVLYKDLD